MALFDDPRSAWTDIVPDGRVAVDPLTRVGIRWHWSGNPTNLTAASAHSSCFTLVKAWERVHMNKVPAWNSIGYNLLVCPHARVIEGRGVDYRGAHSGSPEDNAATYGVQFMVGTGELVSPAMFDRAYYLERELWQHSGHELESSGHRDSPDAATECPGEQVYAWAHTPHTLSTPPAEVDMQFSDIVPGSNPPTTVGTALLRALTAYPRVLEGGWLDQRLDAAEATLTKQGAVLTALAADVDNVPAQVEALVEGAAVHIDVLPEPPAAP